MLFYVLNGWPNKVDYTLKAYFLRRNEISTENGILLWGYCLILPNKLRNRILQELHENHVGMVKMKALARSYIWWPCMDANIEQIARACQSCCSLAATAAKAPIVPWPIPKQCWTRLHVDHFGPFLNKMFFVIEDSTSKWVECFVVNSTSSEITIKCLRSTFARFGLPKEICSDNATVFLSSEFKNF